MRVLQDLNPRPLLWRAPCFGAPLAFIACPLLQPADERAFESRSSQTGRRERAQAALTWLRRAQGHALRRAAAEEYAEAQAARPCRLSIVVVGPLRGWGHCMEGPPHPLARPRLGFEPSSRWMVRERRRRGRPLQGLWTVSISGQSRLT